MTMPRGAGERHADDETRVDAPVYSEPSTHDEPRPPGFPSVGGTAGSARTHRADAPFSRSRDAEHPSGVEPPAGPATDEISTTVGGTSGRWRWIFAGIATVLVLTLVAGTLFFLGTRRATPSLVAEFAPQDVAVYGEVRLDLPGDQRERLASFMSRFPGFADPASFQAKLDDTLQEAFARMGTGLDWERDVAPWFGGQIGLFSATLAPGSSTPPSFVAVFSVKDTARVNELVTTKLEQSEMTPEDHKGRTIWTGSPIADGERMSFAVTDEVVLIGTRSEEVKAALDVRTNDIQGLADDPYFTGQLSAMHTDRLGLVYYDYGRLMEAMPTEGSPLPAECATDFQAGANGKLLGEIRAESDHLAFNMRSQFPSGGNLPPAPSNKRTILAERMPAGTVAYFEMREAGANVKYLVSRMWRCVLPTFLGVAPDPNQLQQLLGTSPEDYFDFLEDAALGLSLSGDTFGGGLIATVDDENVARTRLERLLGVLRLAGGLGGGGSTVDEETHGNATITVIRLGAGFLTEGDAPSIAMTVSGGLLYLGLGDFVTGALDRAAADSLASAPRLQSALSSAGVENAGVVYIDVAALRSFAESKVPEADRADYETNKRPFIMPLTHFVVINRNEAGLHGGYAFLYVE